MSTAQIAKAADRDKSILRMMEVEKIYANGTAALSHFNLDVQENEFLSLLGPSGCGKSTALRIAAGLGNFTSGEIDWPTSTYDSHGNPDREIGFVFQEANLLPWATLRENVYLPLRLKDVSRKAASERLQSVLDMVGLGDFADAYPRELSGGMKMRVSIARALVTKPRLLLMDEPFAALDEITRNRLSVDLLDIRQRTGCTIMFVTHSIYESVFLSSRIVVMAARPGRIIGELRVPTHHRRNARFRLTSEYASYCGQISGLLNQAIQS